MRILSLFASTLTFVLICSFSNAQFSKGMRMVGASIGTITASSGTSEQTVTNIGSTTGKVSGYNINLSPSYGWFITDNTVVGVTVAINPSKEKITFEENGSTFQKDETSQFQIGLGGFARNYFKSGGSFLPFGQVNLNAGSGNSKANGFFYGGGGSVPYKESYETKSSDGFFMNAILNVGATWMVGKNAGFDLTVGYHYSSNKYTTNTTRLRDDEIDGDIDQTATNETETKFTNHRFIIGLGFQVFLDKRK